MVGKSEETWVPILIRFLGLLRGNVYLFTIDSLPPLRFSSTSAAMPFQLGYPTCSNLGLTNKGDDLAVIAKFSDGSTAMLEESLEYEEDREIKRLKRG